MAAIKGNAMTLHLNLSTSFTFFQVSTEMSSLQTEVAVHFVHMKKLNRLAHFRCRKVRETTNEVIYTLHSSHAF